MSNGTFSKVPTAPTLEMISLPTASPLVITEIQSESPVSTTANVESGIASGVNAIDSKDWFSPSFSDKMVAGLFVQKVYAILSFQLAVAFTLCGFCLYVEPVKSYVWFHSVLNGWVLITALVFAMIVCIVIFFIIACFNSDARTQKLSCILLVLFTISISVLLTVVCARYQLEALFIAIGICVACTWLISTTSGSFADCSIPYYFGFFGGTFLISLVATCIAYSVEDRYVYSSSNERIYRDVSIFEFKFGIVFVGASVIMAYFTLDTIVLIENKLISSEEYIYTALRLNFDIIYLILSGLCYPCTTLRTGDRGPLQSLI